jgi:2'-hydroxyisoflavone reductase
VKLLVLGGTKFLGRAAVDAALARGHEVTLFNRGETNAELFPEVEKLRGDRDGDLRALEGRGWDAVIDPSGYVPRVVRASTELLAANGVGHYLFVSSISVYSELPLDYDESAPLSELEDPASEEIRRDYGALKVACERVVEDVFPGGSTLVRAGLIVGPHDPTDRFTYWPVRLARGGEVLAPAPAEQPWQFVDARDLGAWLVRACEERATGPFNATGPVGRTTAGEVLEACRGAAGSDATLTWVDEAFLREREVGEWMELPLWVAQAGEDGHIHTADIRRVVEAGLTTRPVEETVRDTLAWAATRASRGAGTAAMGTTEGVGLDPEKERRLLAEWRARTPR